MRAEAAKYLQILSIGFQDTFVYRWNFILRALFGIVPLVGTIFIWKAVFATRGSDVAGYDQQGMIFYFLLMMLVESLVTPTEDEWRIAAEIREGQISALIIKPLNHLAYRIGLFLSYRALYTCITLPIVAVLFYIFRENLQLPAHASTWPIFIFSTVMAAAIQFFLAYTLAMLAFWILEISTIIFIVYSFEYFLSGQVFPLDIMPAWIQSFLKFCPFTYELFFPVQIFTERVSGDALWHGLIIQAAWVLILFGTARGMWNAGVKKYQAVGG